MRFVCLSDESEYRDLRRDPTAAGRWYFDTSVPLDAADPEVFTLVRLSVDGNDRKIRRSTREGSQQATVSLGPEVVGRDVAISYTACWCNATAACSISTSRDQPRASMSSSTTPTPASAAST